MKKNLVAVIGLAFIGFALFAPSARGGSGPEPAATIGASKAICQDRCHKAGRACSGKRSACAAQKQRCMKGCK
jgi:hypothetical protein